ncbi:hypothetical protein J31TS4_22030 [Paenibacillus sp. J31TS4]|nr:hypothetical protein J31TS4_22030 [Paenibacillus sp. J31TS4]
MAALSFHLTNGDHAAALLRASGLPGEVRAWRDMLDAGPLRPDPDEALLHERARYFERTMGIPSELFLAGCREQELLLEKRVQTASVTLWFEHDLYDQTMLLYLLHRLSRLAGPDTDIGLIAIDRYPGVEPFLGLGQLTPAQLAGLWPRRVRLERAALALGSRLWQAYASPQPDALPPLLRGSLGELRLAGAALARHLERFPSVRDGLSRPERTALELLAAGETDAAAWFRAFTDREPGYGLGDLAFWRLAEGLLAAQPEPLAAGVDGPVRLPRFAEPPPASLRLRLTPYARQVLDGRAQRLPASGTDRWLGGCLLRGGEAPQWRWDAARWRLARP